MIDASTQELKVVYGYQGWFGCEGDSIPGAACPPFLVKILKVKVGATGRTTSAPTIYPGAEFVATALDRSIFVLFLNLTIPPQKQRLLIHFLL